MDKTYLPANLIHMKYLVHACTRIQLFDKELKN